MTKQTLIVYQVLFFFFKTFIKVIIPNENIEGCVDRIENPITPPRNGDVGFLL